MKKYTDITVLVDKSGSMYKIKEDMEGSFRRFLEAHRKVESTRITLIQFDSSNDQQIDYMNVPVRAAGELVINPNGGTPLIDAFCKAIDNTGERLSRMNERERPDQVLFIVITDGEENSSNRFKNKDVENRVTKQREVYKWQFVYLGANQDSFHQASLYGLNRGQTLNFTASPMFAGENSGFANYLTNSTLAYATRASSVVPDASNEVRSKSMSEEDKKKYKNTLTTP